jgi:hypothetical protein
MVQKYYIICIGILQVAVDNKHTKERKACKMIERNIVEDFYYGSLCPGRTHFREGTEYARLRDTVFTNQEILGRRLEGVEKHLFTQLVNAQTEVLEGENLENFLEGWKLGARFMLDTFFSARPKAMDD